jgi:hypothetical protein
MLPLQCIARSCLGLHEHVHDAYSMRHDTWVQLACLRHAQGTFLLLMHADIAKEDGHPMPTSAVMRVVFSNVLYLMNEFTRGPAKLLHSP